MNIEKNTVVAISYSMFDHDGKLLDSNEDYAPLVYLHGRGNIIEELEIGLEGLTGGDAKDVMVVSKHAEVILSHEENGVTPVNDWLQTGERFHFKVNVISVRTATPQEIRIGFPLPETRSGCCQPGCC